jgi:hypothetical protein
MTKQENPMTVNRANEVARKLVVDSLYVNDQDCAECGYDYEQHVAEVATAIRLSKLEKESL